MACLLISLFVLNGILIIYLAVIVGLNKQKGLILKSDFLSLREISSARKNPHNTGFEKQLKWLRIIYILTLAFSCIILIVFIYQIFLWNS